MKAFYSWDKACKLVCDKDSSGTLKAKRPKRPERLSRSFRESDPLGEPSQVHEGALYQAIE